MTGGVVGAGTTNTRIFGIAAISTYLGATPDQVRAWFDAGVLPAERVGWLRTIAADEQALALFRDRSSREQRA